MIYDHIPFRPRATIPLNSWEHFLAKCTKGLGRVAKMKCFQIKNEVEEL
jgi:hypothetical protein